LDGRTWSEPSPDDDCNKKNPGSGSRT